MIMINYNDSRARQQQAAARRQPKQWRVFWTACLVAAVLMGSAATGRAYDIILHYEDELHPSYDPDGSRLTAIF